MQEEERESDLASCYWAARLILLGWCECLNNMKQRSDLWSGCVFPRDTLMPFSGPEWVTICTFLLLIIRLYFILILNEPRSVADKLEVLTSSQALNSADLFFLEAKAANVSMEVMPF